MRIYDQGSGPPLIVVPGVQGRWEWFTPALAALADRCRTISYSLAGDLGSGRRLFPDTPDKTMLTLTDTKVFDSGVVVHTYHPAR